MLRTRLIVVENSWRLDGLARSQKYIFFEVHKHHEYGINIGGHSWDIGWPISTFIGVSFYHILTLQYKFEEDVTEDGIDLLIPKEDTFPLEVDLRFDVGPVDGFFEAIVVNEDDNVDQASREVEPDVQEEFSGDLLEAHSQFFSIFHEICLQSFHAF